MGGHRFIKKMGNIAQKKGLGKKEIKQAEGIINDKINSLADWLETQENGQF